MNDQTKRDSLPILKDRVSLSPELMMDLTPEQLQEIIAKAIASQPKPSNVQVGAQVENPRCLVRGCAEPVSDDVLAWSTENKCYIEKPVCNYHLKMLQKKGIWYV